MKIYISSDHAGFSLKESIISFLKSNKIKVIDLGPNNFNEDDDYPDYAFNLAKKVSKSPSLGILICGSGMGMQIAANKVKGARAVSPYDLYTAEFSKLHNNSNIICLRARDFPIQKTKNLLLKWIKTPFSNSIRHKKRLNKISDYENKK